MKKADLKTILREVKSVERGETAPARVREVTLEEDVFDLRVGLVDVDLHGGDARGTKNQKLTLSCYNVPHFL